MSQQRRTIVKRKSFSSFWRNHTDTKLVLQNARKSSYHSHYFRCRNTAIWQGKVKPIIPNYILWGHGL